MLFLKFGPDRQNLFISQILWAILYCAKPLTPRRRYDARSMYMSLPLSESALFETKITISL